MKNLLCDIIIPVYNSLAQTARCIESVLECSSRPYRLILLNDASDWATTKHLRDVAAAHENTILLENEKNLGFLGTVNRGLSYGLENEETEPVFKLILNSDTLVSPGWLEAFERCFQSDERTGLATALSNNAENISIPVPEGYNHRSMASLAASKGAALGYPDVTTAVGFCMAIRTPLLRKIGLFDEAFSPGYGEESDFHFKVLCKGYRSVVVSDCFVYHENHASFSGNKAALVAHNRPIFDSRWRVIYHNELNEEAVQGDIEQLKTISKGAEERTHDVLFILPTSKLFGGIVVVYEICRRLIDRGIDANAVVLSQPETLPPDLPFVPYFRPDADWVSGNIPRARVYVATHYETSAYAFMAQLQHGSKVAYLVQGYEAWFPGAAVHEVINTVRAIPNRVAVSNWLSTMLKRWGIIARVIPNGVDLRYFYPLSPSPGRRRTKDPVTLFTLLRDDPQAGTMLSERVLRRVRAKLPELRIIAVGNLSAEAPFRELVNEAHASIGRKEIRDIYRRSDIFVDFSMVQGFGLMGLEAMASGVSTVLAATGGAEEYASPANSILVAPGDENGFVNAIIELARDRKKMATLKKEGYATAQKFGWDESARRYADYFADLLENGEESEAEHRDEMLRYLFGRLLRAQLIRGTVTRAQEHLGSGLNRSFPAGALEILRGAFSAPDMERIQTTYEGLALIRLYEKARAAIGWRVHEGSSAPHPGHDLVGMVEDILSGNQPARQGEL